MKYLIFPNQAAALHASADIAHKLGAGDHATDTTAYWYSTRQHPTNAMCALVISDEGNALTQDQREALVDENDLDPSWIAAEPLNH